MFYTEKALIVVKLSLVVLRAESNETGRFRTPRRLQQAEAQRPMNARILLAVFVIFGGRLVARPKFVVYDALGYSDKPSAEKLGMSEILSFNQYLPSQLPAAQINDNIIDQTLKNIGAYSGVIYIDIEDIAVDGVSEVVRARSIKILAGMSRAVHKRRPEFIVGFYGLLPTRAYWPIVGEDRAALAAWRECNRQCSEIGEAVDVVFPSLYTFYNDAEKWSVFARAMLKEARRYNKPVYPFLWPEFHDSNAALSGHDLPSELWRTELRLCRDLADGVVIWGGWRLDRRDNVWKRIEWSEDLPWWRETVGFIRDVGR
jgi:hypothetical protein